MRQKVDFSRNADIEEGTKLLGDLEIILKTHPVFRDACVNAKIDGRTNWNSSMQAISAHYKVMATYVRGRTGYIKVSAEIDDAARTEIKTAIRSVLYQVFEYTWN